MMRLTSLVVQGFKTFVQRSTLEFEPGVTAIVGPNGSGKSNLADAFRWVLGEQSLRALRGRRTEDILFSGGPGRAASGFAEVSLTLEVDAEALPPDELPYREITIARRAYRSGENEYLLNRDRVRLRDVQDVLGRLGLGLDGFALVGQGSIDAALSLRSADRRGLIDQAAAIGHLHQRLAEARERLDQTEQNLTRVSDLLSELGPRLRSLERQARLARERETLQLEFTRGMLRWYAHLWSSPARRLAAARRAGDTARARLDSLSPSQTELATRQAIVEAETAAAAANRQAIQDELTQTQAALAGLRQSRGQTSERRQNVARERAAASASLAQWQATQSEGEAVRDEHAHRRGELATKTTALDAELTTEESAIAQWQTDRSARVRDIEVARAALAAVDERLAAARAVAETTTRREGELARASGERDRSIAARRAEQVASDARCAALAPAVDAAQRELAEAQAIHETTAGELEHAHVRLALHQKQLAAAEQELQQVQARAQALHAAEDGGAGYFAGVRAVLLAANGHSSVHLDGILGVVARLIQVEADHEIAIETALGGHAQDVVVERWVDAEAAIAYLKRTATGRATFLPLDTLRPPRRSAAPNGPGVVGVAASLVTVDARCPAIGDFLLGQTVVVDTLANARLVLRDCAPFWQIVTMSGELARPSGVVTGGAPATSRGTLARQRELRQCQDLLRDRQRQRDRAAETLAESRGAVESLTGRLSDARRRRRLADEGSQQASAVLTEAREARSRQQQTLAWDEAELARIGDQLAAARRAVAAAADVVERERTERELAATSLSEAQASLADFDRRAGDRGTRVAVLRAERDLSHRHLAEVDAALDRAIQRLAGFADRARAEERRTRDLAAEEQALGDQVQRLACQEAEVERTIVDARRRMADAERRFQLARDRSQEIEQEVSRLEEQTRTHVAAQQAAERQIEPALGEIDGLQRQAQLELGQLDEAAWADGRLRVTLPDGVVEEAPVEPAADSDRLRERLAALRSRLRQLPGGSDIVADFEAARERAEFLRSQSDDLRTTAERLRAAVDETTGSMHARFGEAFAAVNATFSRRFVQLFGGGSARLLLESADDSGEDGIEVFAQPPGKRSQRLATLSGGERALTAAALLFALIEAKPPPFCVLDEVDAALDETNVVRFAEALRGLSQQTQIIVVTHNRRTMEAANAIYGLTLENRCETRALSLRLGSSAMV
jgi:chromosome segregation protein